MEIAAILVHQVGVMFLLLVVGIAAQKAGIVGEDGARSMSSVLLIIVVAAVMVRNFQQDLDKATLPAMGMAFLLAALFHLFSIWLANRLCRDTGDGSTRWRVAKIALVFSNAGFMGFPLLLATVGEVGLLYGSVYLGVFNIAVWVWGVPALTGGKRLPPKALLTHPVIVGFALGVLLYLLQIRLPGLLMDSLFHIANLNTPLSMLITGIFLASVKPREALRDKLTYRIVLTRNILLPLLVLAFLWVTRIACWLPGGKVFALAFLTAASCPSGVNAILLPARYDCDGRYGSQLVAASTALSILTLPVIVLLGDLIL